MINTLQAKNLTKEYKSRHVVDNVSLTINQGEIVGLLGPNGAGKTTCFYMIVGLIASDHGQILLNGKAITRLPVHARARAGIGYLPQEASVFRKLTVAQNLMAILELRKELDKTARREQLTSLLNEFNIGHISQSKGYSLSGGERRRVEIARALAMNPKFFLLDEPFAGIDPISVVDIKRIISHLCQRGIGILITDHNVRETLDICHRAYILSEGKLIATGNPKAIMENQKVKDVYLGEEFAI